MSRTRIHTHVRSRLTHDVSLPHGCFRSFFLSNCAALLCLRVDASKRCMNRLGEQLHKWQGLAASNTRVVGRFGSPIPPAINERKRRGRTRRRMGQSTGLSHAQCQPLPCSRPQLARAPLTKIHFCKQDGLGQSWATYGAVCRVLASHACLRASAAVMRFIASTSRRCVIKSLDSSDILSQ